jgi:programmed cell death protein 5
MNLQQPPLTDQAIQSQLAQQAKAQERADMQQELLTRVLQPAALERLRRIKLVKKALAEKVETLILNLAQSGRLQSTVSDADLIHLLNEQESKETTVTFYRKKRLDDDNDDDDDDDLR